MYYGLGQVEEQTQAESAPVEFLRARWDDFVALEPRILDLQHRAAQVAYQASQQGDPERAEQAKDVIRKLQNLAQIHLRIMDRAREVVEYWTGAELSSWGLGAIPVAALTVISGLALLVAWVFRAYAAEERKLDLIEAGVLTPEQAAALDPGPKPGGVLAGLQGVLGWALVAFVGFMVVRQVLEGGFRANPPLMVYGPNPPGPIAEEVHAVYYRHAQDGQLYVHEFEGGVGLEALPDGTVLIHGDDPLWEDFR